MEMESQVSLDSKALFRGENTSIQQRDPSITSLIPDYVEPQQPVKKPTRQWAAWTREEEESFFTALRQVGKNFEKITRRVQSKNKDQVRHYYYRLVRRMNKLLGPGLCLDAKNSKDTNAAMLRWWSLLEKYSCKASKLHLKPRRFKIFIEALENQLLKDRKKNVRRRPSQLENGSPSVPSNVNNQNRAPGNETRTVKLVLMDTQNLQRLGSGKGSLKRNMNISIIRSNRGDSAAMKPARQRRKQGVVSSAAYKKWEKAAIAGVSLVADAAEHLERETTDKEVEHDQGMADQKSPDPVEKGLRPLPSFSQNHCVDSYTNIKLKLQLFPIDDGTRRALEMDNHNPHLELTLSTRKRISSVLEHLNRKWGNSSIASGELMLFPYSVHRENLTGYQRWTQDSIVSAVDVYTSIGSPSVFRLRYGWFSNTDVASVALQATPSSSYIPGGNTLDIENETRIMNPVSTSGLSTNDLSETCKDQLATVKKSHASAPSSTDVSSEISGSIATGPRTGFVESSAAAAGASWHEEGIGDRVNMKQLDDADDLRLSNSAALSAGEWADSLTNISVGDLLSEVSRDVIPNCIETPLAQSGQCLQQIPFSCDSFDAAIAAHMSRHQNKILPSTLTSHTSSIWDAEETCDAFIFQKNRALRQENPTSAVDSAGIEQQTNKLTSGTFVERLAGGDCPAAGDPMDECPPDLQVFSNSAKDFTGLTDIYWPESLGPLDLDLPPSKYHSEEFILSDSLSGLNRLIASSLDAFQNCSFFGLDRKDGTTILEARESCSFSDFKIGSGV
ncbi:TSL-kinase interacting protein 1 isoform X2 [Ricinus communis]|uniref:TSL-kinase interacting protein 1 isoform X2 n=1 Tax=Ricinus communis TaxID=3988 RepID=UPI000772BC5F|nr:TSL-kinase interacting protein 1 isoform X2 [Ricinus communis]|eukprot:XP_015574876.1 TSL-kinase interacting protein 1 isoform X2 [Ricinus communis]